MKPAYRITGNALQDFFRRLVRGRDADRSDKPGRRNRRHSDHTTRSREPAGQEYRK